MKLTYSEKGTEGESERNIEWKKRESEKEADIKRNI